MLQVNDNIQINQMKEKHLLELCPQTPPGLSKLKFYVINKIKLERKIKMANLIESKMFNVKLKCLYFLMF